MEDIQRFDTVKQYNEHAIADTLHPLVSVVRFNEIPTVMNLKAYFGIYAIFFKEIKCGDMMYGCQPYDYDDGTLVFIAPGQVYSVDSNGIPIVPTGYGLVFHPDFIKGTALGKTIREYSFFSYDSNEALHLSKKERGSIIDCLKKIAEEIAQNIDKHTRTLIVSNIELLLNYCMRYYDRQFITRSVANKDVLVRFENLLTDYFRSGKGLTLGLPNVAWCADQLHLSPNYFGDLIKKETGNPAIDHIHNKLIDEAKARVFDTRKSISDVAADLGFKHPQHFTRLFKQKTGMTPNDYRNSN
jgi:AraC-like DNA-binding protein